MKKFFAKIWTIIWKTCLAIFILSIATTVVYKFVPVPITPLMIIRDVEQLSEGNGVTMKHDWVALDEISPKLQLAVVCSEDQNYLKHYGFDWGAIQKAMKSNESGKKIRGASTISQQTAKNVFLWPSRSYVRKAFEMYFTFLIELVWSKERIMEVYLNSIEMGNGIYGAEAASQHWFNKSAKKLTKDEAAAIASVLPNPRRYKASPANSYISARKAWIKQQMNFWGNQLDYNKYKDDDEPKK